MRVIRAQPSCWNAFKRYTPRCISVITPLKCIFDLDSRHCINNFPRSAMRFRKELEEKRLPWAGAGSRLCVVSEASSVPIGFCRHGESGSVPATNFRWINLKRKEKKKKEGKNIFHRKIIVYADKIFFPRRFVILNAVINGNKLNKLESGI